MEEWRDIKGYEDAYQVSSLGRIRTKDRYLNASYGSRQFRKGQMVRGTEMPNGYLCVGLWKDGKSRSKYIHRIVAENFIPNANDLPEVNHKDENKQNNRVDNLEWCDHKYNLNYGSVKERIGNANRNGKFWSREIAQYKNGVLIATYPSSAEAERQTGVDASAIRKVCLGKPKFKTAGGYIWKAL